MAENITQFQAGKALLALLEQQGLPKQVVQQITQLTAELIQQASGGSNGATNSNKPTQQQQQQQQPSEVRDLQAAEATLPGLSFVIPRGKFDCGIFSDCLQASNKQTGVQVPWGSIQNVLIIDAIPKQPSTTYVVLVMKSGQPVRQGKNWLDLVVVQTKDQPELSIPSPEACQHLGPSLCGAAAVVLSQLAASYIEDVDDATFLTADSAVFRSSAGDLMVAANKGVQPGWLVPLSAGLCYVGKQGSFMPKGTISKVLFHRTGGGSATFDITIKLLAAAGGAGGGAKQLELGQIDAAELPRLQGYCADQRIRVGGDDDDEEGGEPAAAAAAAAAGGGGAAAADEDDDDDEEDEDFDPERQHASKRRRTLDAGPAGGEEGSGEDEDEGSDEEEDGDDESEAEDSDGPDLVPSAELDDMDDEEAAEWGDE